MQPFTVGRAPVQGSETDCLDRVKFQITFFIQTTLFCSGSRAQPRPDQVSPNLWLRTLLRQSPAYMVQLLCPRWICSEYLSVAQLAQLNHNLLPVRPIRQKWTTFLATLVCCGKQTARERLQVSTAPVRGSVVHFTSNAGASFFFSLKSESETDQPSPSCTLISLSNTVYHDLDFNLLQESFVCTPACNVSCKRLDMASCQHEKRVCSWGFRSLSHVWCCVAVWRAWNSETLKVLRRPQSPDRRRAYSKHCNEVSRGSRGCWKEYRFQNQFLHD